MLVTSIFKILFACFLSNVNQNKLTLEIKIDNPIVYKRNDLLIKLELINSTNNPILIHKHPQFNYLSQRKEDFCFTVEKKAKNNYGKIEELSGLDPFEGYDSSRVSWSDIYDTLAPGKIRTDQFNISGYYNLQKGKYRTKFTFSVSNKNNPLTKIVYSNWIYFEVKSRDLEYFYGH